MKEEKSTSLKLFPWKLAPSSGRVQ